MKIIITEDQYRLLKETNMTEDNLYRFLYSLWDRQKKMGEEPHLDDVIYDVTGITKGSEEDNQTIRPIWFEYNGGYNNLLEKLKEELLNKELSFEGNQNLKLKFMVDDIESYDDGRWKGEVDITCHLLDGTVDGYAYDDFSWDYCDDTEFVTRIEVKTAYKTEPYAVKGMEVVELGIIFYIDTVFDSIDVGEYFWELEKYLEPYLGKDNFKIKLLNVINENPRANW